MDNIYNNYIIDVTSREFKTIGSVHNLTLGQDRKNSISSISGYSISTFATNLSTDSRRTNSGRVPGLFLFDVVEYNNKKYIVATIRHKYEDVQFVCDYDDLQTVSSRNWHISSGKYIGTNIKLGDGTYKEVFLHTYLIKGLTFVDEEDSNYVVHLNKNTFDNRRENLRIVSASDLFLLKTKKKRIIQLPEDAVVNADDIPKHVCYIKPNGEHGPRFSIELPTLGIYWKTSSSKKLSLQDKLQLAKDKLKEIYDIYPDMNPNKDATLVAQLNTGFTEIITLAKKDEPAQT